MVQLTVFVRRRSEGDPLPTTCPRRAFAALPGAVRTDESIVPPGFDGGSGIATIGTAVFHDLASLGRAMASPAGRIVSEAVAERSPRAHLLVSILKEE